MLEMFIMVCFALWALTDESHRQHITPIFSGPCNNKVHRHQISFKGTRGLQVQDCYIWDIYNLCALDVVICKKLQRNFNGLEAERGRKKKSLIWLFAPFFKSKSLLHQKENEKFWVSKKFQQRDCNHREKENFIFLFRRFIDHVSHLSPAPLHDLSSGYQHCPIQSRRKCYFHWSTSSNKIKEIETDNRL